jgi:hypothetical protein
MACLLTSGYSLGCRDSLGGIQEVYIGLWNGDNMTIGLTGSNNIVNSFTGSTVSFYSFQQELETASFNQNGQFNSENGTSFYEQTLEITLQKMDATNRAQATVLGQGVWRVMILDQRGQYWLMGKTNPVRVSASTPNVGKAFGDLNGIKLTFMVKESEPAYNVTSAAAASVIV